MKRRLEGELVEVRDQLAEKTTQLVDLQAQVNKREEDLQKALNKWVVEWGLVVGWGFVVGLGGCGGVEGLWCGWGVCGGVGGLWWG